MTAARSGRITNQTLAENAARLHKLATAFSAAEIWGCGSRFSLRHSRDVGVLLAERSDVNALKQHPRSEPLTWCDSHFFSVWSRDG